MFKKRKQKGLILLELVVSLGIFLSVMTIGMGALLTMYGVNKKSQTLKTIMTDLNFAIDSMAREIVVGTNYHCGVDSGDIEDPLNCEYDYWINGGDDSITFCSSNNEQIFYRYNAEDPQDQFIQRYIEVDEDPNDDVGTCADGVGDDPDPDDDDWERITSTEVVITGMQFYVHGAEETQADVQPITLVSIQGEVGNEGQNLSKFRIQTSLSQRTPKI